jgi:hypothetical protein
MVQQATIEEAVFSIDPTDMPIDWLDSDNVLCVGPCPFHNYVRVTIRSGQLQVSQKLEWVQKNFKFWGSRLKTKYQEDFTVIWSASFCVEIRCQETSEDGEP